MNCVRARARARDTMDPQERLEEIEVEADQIRATVKVGLLAVNDSPRCPLIPPASTWFAFAPSA